jgi:hypothetical protein
MIKEQRKDTESCKRKTPAYIQTHKNHFRPLSPNPKSQDIWSNIIQTLRESKCQPRMLYPAKTFHDKNKLSSSCPPSLHCRRYLGNISHKRGRKPDTNTRGQ